MIKLSLLDDDTTQLKIVSGARFEKDLARVQKLPTAKAQWTENAQGDEVCTGHIMPRIDLADVLDAFKPNEIMMDASIQRDKRMLAKLKRGPDKNNAYTGKINSVFPLHAHQDHWVRTDPNCRRIFNLLGTGAGKTLMSLERVRLLGARRTLVVTIGNAFQDWKTEATKWLAKVGKGPDRIIEYKGTVQRRAKLRGMLSKATIVLASYQLAGELNGLMFDSFIFDEQDLLANPLTKRAEKIMPLLNQTWHDKNNQVIIQTATPTGNTPSTAYLANWLLHPLLAGSFESYKARHETLIDWTYKTIPVKGKDGSVRWMNKRFERKVLFANKDQMVDRFDAYSSSTEVKFPFVHKKLTTVIDMTDQQKDVYEELRDELEAYVGRRHIKVKEARTKLLRLLQASEGLFNFDIDCLESGKLDYIVSFLKRTDHKVLIWSRFRPILDVLQNIFPEKGISYHGGLSSNQRKINRWAFNGAKGADKEEYNKLLISSPEQLHVFKPGEAQFAFGIMHSMTSRATNWQAADYAILTTLTFSNSALIQTIGRHARLDQKAPTIYTKQLLSEDTNEAAIRDFVTQRLKNMSLTKDGNEALNLEQMRQLARVAIQRR